MAYTVKQVREAFPEVQFAGGVGIVLVKGKHVDLGRVAADGEFVASVAGAALLAEAKAPVDAKPARGKAKGKGSQEPVAPAPAPDEAIDDLGLDNPFGAAVSE